MLMLISLHPHWLDRHKGTSTNQWPGITRFSFLSSSKFTMKKCVLYGGMENRNQKEGRWGCCGTDPAEGDRSPSMSQSAVESRWRSIWWARLSRSCWADSQAQTPTLEALPRHKQQDITHVKSTSTAVTDRGTGTLLKLHLQESCSKLLFKT